MNQTNKEELRIVNIELIATIIFIGSLIISTFIQYNKKLFLENNIEFPNNNTQNIAIINKIIVVILALVFLYGSYKDKEIAQKKGLETKYHNLEIIASEFVLIATLIVLYVTIKTSGNQYTVTPGVINSIL